MTNKKSNESRRKLLKSIAAGSGAVIAGKSLPESWSKPVVDSVMLPAHAETSPSANLTGSYTGTLYVEMNFGEVDGNLLDTLIPTAHAQNDMMVSPWHFCINVTDGHAEVQATNEYYEGIWTASSYLDFHRVKMKNEIKGDPFPLFAVTAVWDPAANQLNCKAGIDGYVYEFVAHSVPDGGKCELEATELMVSDRNIKENFSDVDEQNILEKVANLSIEHWSYTDRDKGVRHIGPMAQDFMAAFSVGDSDRHIHMVDANGVNLAAIKALNTKLEEKEAQIQTMQKQLDEVMKRLDKLV